MNDPEATATLKDGSTVAIRRLNPCDRDCITQGFDRLSARSRHLRFFSPLNKLSNAQLTYLTEVDGVNHAVVAAFATQGDEAQGVGVARYIRLKDEPEVAEFALTVIDAFQGRGVGSVLLDALIELACANDVQVLRGYVLASNAAMTRMLERRGAVRERQSDGSLRFDLNIGGDRSGGTHVPPGTRR